MTLAEELGADFELTITGGVEPLYTEEEVRAAEKTIQVAHSLGPVSYTHLSFWDYLLYS